MIEVYYQTEDDEPRGVGYVPSIPRIGERILILLTPGDLATFEVTSVDYRHRAVYDQNGQLGYYRNNVQLFLDEVVVIIRELGGDVPGFPYSQPH